MRNVIKEPVLVLNTAMMAINVTTVEEAIKMMVVGTATALDIVSPDEFYITKWSDWITLPIREKDRAVRSAKLTVRAPTVIISRHTKLPKSKPRINTRNIKSLYKGICQYTGKYAPDGNVDHIVPKSRGGQTVWQNLTWSKKNINSRKGNKLNSEIGLPELKGKVPLATPIAVKLPTRYNRNSDWEMFLVK